MGIKGVVEQTTRVLRLAKKPSWEEVRKTAKITGIGIIVLGVIGYIIHWAYYFITNILG